MEGRRGRGRHRTEAEGGDDAEVAAAGAAKSPEQLLVVTLVAIDDASVGQNDLRAEELIAGKAVLVAEDPDAAAEREAGNPDRRPATSCDRELLGSERLVHVPEPCTRADRRDTTGHRNGPHRRDVDHDAARERTADKAVPTAPDRGLEAEAARDRDRRGGVGRLAAQHDRLRASHLGDRQEAVVEPGNRGPAQGRVLPRARKDDVAGDRRLQRTPVRGELLADSSGFHVGG
jgi:hypothetical protein